MNGGVDVFKNLEVNEHFYAVRFRKSFNEPFAVL